MRTIYRLLIVWAWLSFGAIGCDPADQFPPLTNAQLARNLVAAAKKDISAKKYSDAIQKCEKAEKLDPKYDEAPYCVLLGNLGAMVQSTSGLISLIASQVGSLKTSAICAPQISAMGVPSGGCNIMGGIVSQIEGQMAYIDTRAFVLAGRKNPTFQIDDFPLGLDPADLFKLAGWGKLPENSDLRINLKGMWDKSEVLLLGVLVNTVQGLLDYLFAHNLNMKSTDLGEFDSAGIAGFFLSNPELFIQDTVPEVMPRIGGNENSKGLKNDFLSALSYAVGRGSLLARVAPVNEGLAAAIKQSAKNGAPDSVILWIGAETDGIPEDISIPAFAELATQVSAIKIKHRFINPLDREAWLTLIDLGKAMRDNIENPVAPISVHDAVVKVAAGLHDEFPAARLLKKVPPDLAGWNLGAFLRNPLYIREMLPYYFQYDLQGDPVRHADLAYEIETYMFPLTNQNEKIGMLTDEPQDGEGDFGHFDYSAFVSTAAAQVTAYTFTDFPGLNSATLKIAADGIAATAVTPFIPQIALQSPSFGGLLNFDLAGMDGTGGNYVPPTSAQFNEGLARILKYYCLDLRKDGFDIFDEDQYAADRKIEACP